jgi:hypothetical protein
MSCVEVLMKETLVAIGGGGRRVYKIAKNMTTLITPTGYAARDDSVSMANLSPIAWRIM